MSFAYDKHYQTENLFGEPYPELISFFSAFEPNGTIADLGCGQGRNAIALARMGFRVLGIDTSRVGIEQMNRIAEAEGLDLIGKVQDLYEIERMDEFDFVLLDSMLHFEKRDREKELGLIRNILDRIRPGCIVVICLQDIGEKVKLLNVALYSDHHLKQLRDQCFRYVYEDKESGHKSETPYRMVAIEKMR